MRAFKKRALLVGANVACQHQHIGARHRLGRELGMGLQVEVGQKLDLHAQRPGKAFDQGRPLAAALSRASTSALNSAVLSERLRSWPDWAVI